MRPLPVVMLLIRSGHFAGFLQRARPMHKHAFVFVRAVITFDVGLLLGLMRRTDVGVDAQTEQKPTQSRGEIAATLAAYPTWIAVKGEHAGQAIASEKGHYGVKSGLSTKVFSHLRLQ
jgi:hypothetical protein